VRWSRPYVVFSAEFIKFIPCQPYNTQGRALVRAIEALGTIQPSGPFERALARLLIAAYKRRLRGIVEIASAWVSEEILSASEHIGDDRAVLWISEN
jgi:hypothetical protein